MNSRICVTSNAVNLPAQLAENDRSTKGEVLLIAYENAKEKISKKIYVASRVQLLGSHSMLLAWQ
jgi:hypothetical protein